MVPARLQFRRRYIAAGSAFALLAVGLISGTAPLAASAATGSVTGKVFRDFNGDGIRAAGNGSGTGLANDSGIAGVTITAYDDAGDSWTTTSAADGSYSLAITDSSASAVRVQFTGLPAGYEDGAVHGAGADTGTAVQFVNVGSNDVDFAANVPEDYTQPGGAPLVTAVQWAGSPFAAEGGTKMNEPALAGVSYDGGFSGAQPGGFPGRVTIATFGEVGSVSANVYQSSSNSVFAAATYKRDSGLGTLGLGGIYRVTDVLAADNTASGAGSVVPWLDVEAIGIDVGQALSNTDRGLAGHLTQTRDPDAFAQAGKVGIGDMALSSDGNTLYFVNLFDKKLYSVDVSDPAVPPTSFQSYDLGLDVGERPWALTIYRGEAYVGFVDSGETIDGAQPGVSAATAGLGMHVIKAPLAALNSGWTTVLDGSLGYTKGDVINNTLAPQSRRWNTWTDTWNWPGGSVAQPNGGWQIYPQPILSDLYFDEDGYLSLGFTDRTSIQGSDRNLAADPNVPGANYEAGASGDILIAAPAAEGTLLLENNGTVGDRTTSSNRSDQGPGGRNFYDDGQDLGASNTHQETALGQLAGIRGTREVITTSYDPLVAIRAAGLMWDSVNDGTPNHGYELTPDGGGNGQGGNFQKGGGLGGISVLANLAPVEIGNRTWFDADKDGIQDPSEPAVSGVTVELIRDGQVVGSTVTNAKGEYYFSSDETSDFFVDGLEPNGGDYTVRFVPPTTGNVVENDPVYGTVPWSLVNFTLSEPTSTEVGSNPDPSTGLYTFTIGGPGQNNHSIDAGFIINTTPTVDIEKGDGSGETIVHDADTQAESETYKAGEIRTIVYTVTNTGDEPLRNVVLTDETLDGASVRSLTWTMPDGTTVDSASESGILTARWEATFAPGTATWAPGDIITGTAQLVVGDGGSTHADRATVTGVGAVSGNPVSDADDYHANVPENPAVEVPPTAAPTAAPSPSPAPSNLASTGAAAVMPVTLVALIALLAGAGALIARFRREKNS